MSQPSAPAPQDGPAIQPPPTLGIIAIIILIAALAAQILTPGEFQREERTIKKQSFELVSAQVQEGDTIASIRERHGLAATSPQYLFVSGTKEVLSNPQPGQDYDIRVFSTGSRTVVIPGSYAPIDREDRTLLESVQWVIVHIFIAPIQGFNSKSSVIAFILLIGGAFGIIMATGAIDNGLAAGVKLIENLGVQVLVTPLVMILFSLGGAIFGMSEEVIPFVMITIPLALRLGYDSITGLCMSFVAAGLGFAGAFINPFTLGIAQGIADLPPLSGMGFRVQVWIAVTAIGVAYAMWWAARVKARPEISPVYETDRQLREELAAPEGQQHAQLTVADTLVLLVLAGTVGFTAWGVYTYAWYMSELSAVFVAGGVLSALVGNIGFRDAVAAFVKGATDLVGAALVVAFAAGIVYVLESGQVIDTILQAIASSTEGAGAVVSTWLMFLFQSLLNFFVPSGSGQAAMTMPIMAPLSDLVGVSRQTAVLAYQFGDGFSNMIIPTSAVTMSVLGIARIPWWTWAKWLLPLELILFVFGLIVLLIAVLTGFS